MFFGQNVSSGPAPTTVTFGGYGSAEATGVNVTGTWNSSPSAGNGALLAYWHTNATNTVSVCNGTGTDGCTGSDTFTSLGTYVASGSAFKSEIYLMCNLTQTGNPTITMSGSSSVYAIFIYFSGQTTGGCNDGSSPKDNQAASGTPYTTGAITTTNAHDLLLGIFYNNTGGTYTIGTDGQGNAMTFATGSGTSVSGVVSIEYKNEAATNTYTPAITGPNTAWNGRAVAIK